MLPSAVREAAALECFVDRARIAIPVEAVAQIVEYDVASPFPLGQKHVGGLGLHDGKVVISVSLSARGVGSIVKRRRTKGILLSIPRRTGIDWALEVGEVGSFVRVAVGG